MNFKIICSVIFLTSTLASQASHAGTLQVFCATVPEGKEAAIRTTPDEQTPQIRGVTTGSLVIGSMNSEDYLYVESVLYPSDGYGDWNAKIIPHYMQIRLGGAAYMRVSGNLSPYTGNCPSKLFPKHGEN